MAPNRFLKELDVDPFILNDAGEQRLYAWFGDLLDVPLILRDRRVLGRDVQVQALAQGFPIRDLICGPRRGRSINRLFTQQQNRLRQLFHVHHFDDGGLLEKLRNVRVLTQRVMVVQVLVDRRKFAGSSGVVLHQEPGSAGVRLQNGNIRIGGGVLIALPIVNVALNILHCNSSTGEVGMSSPSYCMGGRDAA